MFEDKIIKRIPGQVSVSPKEKQGYLEDLCKLSKVQLNELLDRQKAILRNKAFVKRLPDKGEKISNFKSRIESELLRREEVEKTTSLLERLNINGPLDEIEWTGSFAVAKKDEEKPVYDEDDETSVIKILASHGRTSKIISVVESPEKLITEKDLADIEAETGPYASALCKKVAERSSVPIKESFKPFRSLKSKGESSSKMKEMNSKPLQEPHSQQDEEIGDAAKSDVNAPDGKGDAESSERAKRVRHWEVTAATPPLAVHGPTLMIDLKESLALEKASIEKTLAARTTQAMLRLTEQLNRESFMRYREHSESSSDEEVKVDQEEQLGDEDEVPEKDEAVVYSLLD